MNEDKATRYHRLRRRAEVGSLATSAAFLIALIPWGAAVRLRDAAWSIASGLAPPGFIDGAERALAVCVYVTALVLLHELVSAPWAWYLGFLLEHRYELSREPLTMWVRDHVKAVALGWVFALAGALGVQAAMVRWSDAWWLVATIGFGAVMVALTTLAPVVLLPLFYRVTPVDREGLVTRLLRLAEKARTRVLGVYEWELSAKTRKANAALVGLRHTRRILVSDTLLDQFTDEEIEVVLAHELAHHVHRDIWRALGFEMARMAVSLGAAHITLRAATPALGLQGIADLAALPLLLIVVGGFGLASVPIANALSRAHERRADRYALDLTGNAAAFMSAMRRLGAQNLAEDEPSRTVELLFHTHPPLRQRLAAAQDWLASRVPAE